MTNDKPDFQKIAIEIVPLSTFTTPTCDVFRRLQAAIENALEQSYQAGRTQIIEKVRAALPKEREILDQIQETAWDNASPVVAMDLICQWMTEKIEQALSGSEDE